MSLKQPGSVVLGYVSVQPGEWGRFKGLPVRKDVSEALIAQGLTVLRYGRSMVNCPEYRWKQMIGPRERRQPYKGTWYPYSTNGRGIIDFMMIVRALIGSKEWGRAFKFQKLAALTVFINNLTRTANFEI